MNLEFLLGLICKELKLPNDFIPKLKYPILRSDNFNQFLEDCENKPSKIKITYCWDIAACTTRNCKYELCIDQDARTQLAIDHLKEG